MSKEKVTEDISAREPPKDGDLPLAQDEKQTPKPKLAIKNATNSENSRSFEEQVKHYERRIRAHQKAKDRNSEGEVLSNLGILYYKASKYFDARTCHERHLNLAKSSQNKRAEKRAYCNLGCTYRRIGNLDRAIECYEEGLRLVKELNDKHGEAKLLNNLGNILEQQGDFDQAVYYHRRRLDVAKEVNDLDGESKACASLGNIYHLLGNIRESINHYEKLVACLKYKLAKQEKKGKGEECSGSEGTAHPHSSSCSGGEYSKLTREEEGEKTSNSTKNSGKTAVSETNKRIGSSFGILSNGEEFSECI